MIDEELLCDRRYPIRRWLVYDVVVLAKVYVILSFSRDTSDSDGQIANKEEFDFYQYNTTLFLSDEAVGINSVYRYQQLSTSKSVDNIYYGAMRW